MIFNFNEQLFEHNETDAALSMKYNIVELCEHNIICIHTY